jgi:hypothetical protein
MRKFIIAAVAALPLVACTAFNQNVVDPLITDLSKINATATADLQQAVVVANAATPPDQDGANCANAAIGVSADINKVFAAANGGTSASGPLTLAELASLFQPGSIQYDTEKQKLQSGCAGKAADVLGAAGVLAAGGVVGALAASSSILPVAGL